MIGFVILHYQNIDVTHECIMHLNALKDDIVIVIVDNCSPNGTGRVLKKEYFNCENILVILNNSNQGFAAGNNVGYRYAKEKLGCNIIVVMNSDVYIYDEHFAEKIKLQYLQNTSDAILAPDIISKNGQHQNPFLLSPISSQKQKEIILRKSFGRILYSIPFLNEFLLFQKKNKQSSRIKKKILEEKINVLPHGACLIFLPNWIKNENDCFLKGTFLFCEEEIIYDYAQYKGYVIRYIPGLEVQHIEDASQDADNKTLTKKKKMQLRCEIQSRNTLLRYRKKYIQEEEK